MGAPTLASLREAVVRARAYREAVRHSETSTVSDLIAAMREVHQAEARFLKAKAAAWTA